MLPPIATSRPASLSTWAISAVVVDLPLVPVIATKGASGALTPRSRTKSSTSPMIGTPASSARFDGPMRLRMGERHAGRENKHPEAAPVGLSEIDERERPRPRRARGRPGCRPRRPLRRRPRQAHAPSTAPTRQGRRERRSVRAGSRPASSSPQLQRGEADHREHEGDDPEAHDDLRLRPAELLEMVMNGRHAEHAPAR